MLFKVWILKFGVSEKVKYWLEQVNCIKSKNDFSDNKGCICKTKNINRR